MDRSAQPIYIKTNEVCDGDRCFNNRLNAFMDSCWDGFYTCQFREQRFPTMIKQGADEYEVEYTGTPPIEQQFVLHGETGSPGFTVKIKYSNGDRSYMIQDKDGNIQSPTPWSNELADYAPITLRRCGENRFRGVVNILEFYIEPDCPLFIRPRDAIMLGVRLEFPMNEFFESGGVLTFTQKMIGVLGIHQSELRVVSCYEGSTIINFEIIRDLADEIPLDLVRVEQNFRLFATTADSFMGTPILGAVVETVAIITPNSPVGEAVVEAYEDIWDIDEDGTVKSVVTERDVKVDIIYNDITVNYNKDKSAETKSYIVMIGLICVILLLIGAAMCLYKKLLAKPDVRKAHHPLANLAHKSQIDSNEDGVG